MTLIPDLRKAWKFWSIRVSIVGTAVMGYLLAFPEIALNALASLPFDIKQYLPENYTALFGISFFILSIIARIIKQEKLDDKQQKDK